MMIDQKKIKKKEQRKPTAFSEPDRCKNEGQKEDMKLLG
jgi:hypothetical protein